MNDEARPPGADVAPAKRESPQRRGGKRDRAWTMDPETTERIEWAMRAADKLVETEPWAAVVLGQVTVEVTLAWVVHVLTLFQEPAMRTWIAGLKIETLTDRDERRLFNALIAETGEKVE